MVGPESLQTKPNPWGIQMTAEALKKSLEQTSPLYVALEPKKCGYKAYYYTQPPASLMPKEANPKDWTATYESAAADLTFETFKAYGEKLSAGPKASLDLETAFKPPDEK